MMVRAISFRGESSEWTFIGNSGGIEPQRITAQRPFRFSYGKAQHRCGINAAAQKKTYRDVADHVSLNSFFKKLYQMVFRLLETLLNRCEGEIPITMRSCLSVFDRQIRSR